MVINENYKGILEILKSEPIIIIDLELNKFYNSLNENETNNFLKWLQLNLLTEWKISRKSNQNQTNLIVKKLFLNNAEFFSQKIDFLDNWIIEKRNEILSDNLIVDKPKSKNYKIPIIKFNHNNWNEVTFKLFEYLCENYEKKGKVKYTNIFKYLKNISKSDYAFNFTQSEYKDYILKNYDVNITTFNTSNFDYDDNEKPILNSFERDFRKEMS